MPDEMISSEEKIKLTDQDYYNYHSAKKLISHGDKTEALPEKLRTSLEKVLEFKKLYDKRINSVREELKSKKPEKKKWTALIYADGTNNLDDVIYKEIKAIESKTKNLKDINLVLRHSRADGKVNDYVLKDLGLEIPDVFKSIFPSQIYINTPGGAKNEAKNMGDEKTLSEFLTKGIKAYPAEHYYVMLNDHGSGHMGVCLDEKNKYAGSNKDDRLTLKEQEKALKAAKVANGGKPIDLLMYNACLMGSQEIISQLEGEVKVIAGSEKKARSGYPSENFFSRLGQYNDAKKLAKDMVEDKDKTSTETFLNFSAIDVEKTRDFERQLKNFSECVEKLDPVKDKNTIDELKECAENARLYEFNPFAVFFLKPVNEPQDTIDLYQFSLEVEKNPSIKKEHPEIINSAKNLKEEFKKIMIAQRDEEEKEHGISIFLPQNKDWIDQPYDSAYEPGERQKINGKWTGEEIRIIQNTGWDKVIEKLVD